MVEGYELTWLSKKGNSNIPYVTCTQCNNTAWKPISVNKGQSIFIACRECGKQVKVDISKK